MNRLIILSVLLLLQVFPVLGQQASLDTALYHQFKDITDRFSRDHKYDSAVFYYNRMIELADHKDTLFTLAIRGKADAFMDMERFEDALKLLHKIEKDSLPKSKAIQFVILVDLGDCYMLYGDVEQSGAYYEKALDFSKKWFGEDSKRTATVYSNMGALQNLLHNSEKAREYLNKSLSIYSETLKDDDDIVLKLHNNLGITYYDLKDYDQALYYFQKNLAVRIEKFGPGHPQLAGTYNNLGFLEMSKGDGPAAFDYYQKGIACFIDTPDTLSSLMALLVINTGQYYMFDGKYDTAIEYFKKGLSIRRQLFGPENYLTLLSYMGVGEGYRTAGRLHEALKYFQIAAKLREEHPENQITRTALLYTGIGKVYRDLGEYDKALVNFQKYLMAANDNFEDPDPASNPTIASNLGESQLSGMTAKSRTFYLKYLNETHDDKDLGLALSTYTYTAKMIEFMKKDMLNEGSVLSLMEDARPVYQGYLDAIGEAWRKTNDSSYIDLAFKIMEKGRAVVLSKSLQESEAKKFAGVPDALTKAENEIKSYLSLYNNKLYLERKKTDQDTAKVAQYEKLTFKYKLEYDSLVKKMERDYPEYYQLKYKPPAISISDVQNNLLKENEVLLAYTLTDDHIHIMTIGNGNRSLVSMKSDSTFQEKLKDFRTAITSSSTTVVQFTALSNYLYGKLITPVENTIDGKDLVIIPDGMLSYVPFGLLVKKQDGQTTSFRNLPYLMLHHNLSYTYSAALLSEEQKSEKTQPNSNYLAFAPDFNSRKAPDDSTPALLASNDVVRGSLVELEGTEREIDAIKSHNSGSYFEGLQASEANFKKLAPKYGIIHLATHAILDDKNPMNSRLLFTIGKDSAEDGNLHAWELYNMKLNAQMVVLSACNTGFGKIQDGEGVMSLGHAFAYAGCPSIIMSLWPAQDQATADLMIYFYDGLSNGLAKDKALHDAKLRYLKTAGDLFTPPFYWAGFVVEGDARPLVSEDKINYWLVAGVLAIMLGLGAWLFRKRLVS